MIDKNVEDAARRYSQLLAGPANPGYGHPYEYRHVPGGWYVDWEKIDDDKNLLSSWAAECINDDRSRYAEALQALEEIVMRRVYGFTLSVDPFGPSDRPFRAEFKLRHEGLNGPVTVVVGATLCECVELAIACVHFLPEPKKEPDEQGD